MCIRDREELLKADKVIVPGVGAFEDAMGKMNHYGLTEVIREIAAKKKMCIRDRFQKFK